MHKAQVSTKLIETLQERFRSLDEKIWESMKWFDPKFWTIEKDFGEVGVEWKLFKRYVRHNFVRIVKHKLSLLAELVFALSGSNSSVERGISFFWTTSLSDKRLKMSHAVLEIR